MLENGFLTRCWTVCVEFELIHEGRKMTVFEQKPWAIAHGFEHDGFWQVLEFAPNSVKRLLSAWKWISNTLQDYLCRIRANSRGSENARFWPNPWAIAHGFENGGFWQVLEFAPNSVKRLLSAWKWISNTLLFYLCRIRVNSRGSEIDRFWPKTLGYSPWFWKWRILASSGIRSKLRETPPKCLKMDF